ncbi:unnamed protein product [Menidia menidia]|uniref:(Atlantic silverside) hypothetical protein n=1 Tax=Menidia menidia TaxID=238744 RepID=A0A8S4BR35_9TELE|nr:unnamed protein product [Menidia menidia]
MPLCLLLDSSPVGPPPSSLLARQLQDSWRSLRGAGGGGGLVPAGRRPPDSLMFEVTDATVVMDGSSKYVVSSIILDIYPGPLVPWSSFLISPGPLVLVLIPVLVICPGPLSWSSILVCPGPFVWSSGPGLLSWSSLLVLSPGSLIPVIWPSVLVLWSVLLYTIHVIQSGGSDKTPAVISRRYSDFQKLHAALRRHHGDQMERVSFPRKKLRRNFTSETIGRRSRAFEQYLSHLCSLLSLRGAPCLRDFFYLRDLQAGQQLIRAGRFQEALAPLLNAKRLQHRLGGAGCPGSRAGPAPPASSHWLFTLAGLSCCFREANQLEEARDHCDQALRLLAPAEAPPPQTGPAPTDRPRPHPLLLPLLQAVVRLCWQTGRAKRQWEELLQQLVEQQGGLDPRPPSLTEALLSHDLQEAHGEAASA